MNAFSVIQLFYLGYLFFFKKAKRLIRWQKLVDMKKKLDPETLDLVSLRYIK